MRGTAHIPSWHPTGNTTPNCALPPTRAGSARRRLAQCRWEPGAPADAGRSPFRRGDRRVRRSVLLLASLFIVATGGVLVGALAGTLGLRPAASDASDASGAQGAEGADAAVVRQF